MSYYTLWVDGKKTEFETEAKSPKLGLLRLCQLADLSLVSQEGRYGRAVVNKEHTVEPTVRVMALTQTWTRRRLDPDERTTRVGAPR